MKIHSSLAILSYALLAAHVHGQGAVGSPPIPAVYDIPGAVYAVFDVSGNLDGNWGIQALDDQNNVAFTTADSSGSNFAIFGWVNGSTSQLQSFSATGADATSFPDPSDPTYTIQRTSSLYPAALTASGKVYGSRYLHYVSNGGQIEEYNLSFVSVNETITNLDGDPVSTWPDQITGLIKSANNVYFATGDDWAGAVTKSDANGFTDLGFTYINHAGSYNYFSSVGSNSFYTISANATLTPSAMNSTGWLTSNSQGDPNVSDAVWNGTSLVSLPFSPVAVNDQGLVIGDQPFYSQYNLVDTKGYLGIPGPNSTMTSINFTDLFSQSAPFKQWASQMSWIYPLLISNRNANTGEVHILFTAIAPISSSQRTLTNQAFVLTLDTNNQPSRLAPLRVSASIQFPSALGQAFTSINSSGAILALGNLAPTDPLLHTLLLLPVDTLRDDVLRTDDDDLHVVLDDWPLSGSNPRSPKYLFAKSDNIFVKVSAPQGMESGKVQVKVTSESDTTGLTFDLAEISPETYINKPPAKPLRLGDQTEEQSDSFTIKVVDRELLTFTLLLNGTQSNANDVMVAKAKFAGAGTPVFWGSSIGDRTTVRTEALTNTGFFDAGDGFNDLRMGLKYAGAHHPETDQASFYHFSSHGGGIIQPNGEEWGTGRLFNDNHTMIVDPAAPDGIINSTDWNEDVKWVILDSCLNIDYRGAGGKAKWMRALYGNPYPAHGILGAWDSLDADLRAHNQRFWQLLRTQTTTGEFTPVTSAYMNAMELTVPPQPCGTDVPHVEW